MLFFYKPKITKTKPNLIRIANFVALFYFLLMELHPLTAISPIDGRYWKKVQSFSEYFSEYALIRFRLQVEIEYFIALCMYPLPSLKNIDSTVFLDLRKIYQEFSEEDALEIKKIEATTNHDIKAVEYFIKSKFDQLNLFDYKEFVHFALTSQDINNTAIPLSLKLGLERVYYPILQDIAVQLDNLAKKWDEIPMLARTHGQPASPTKLGKEIRVFLDRLENQYALLPQIPYSAKFGGATGNFNAHKIAYPKVDWIGFANDFIESLGLQRSQITTQIEHYDNLAALLDNLRRLNTIFIDLARDIWQYISLNYFKQKIKANEVGSSAMPHKVNPIDFENAEGNFGIANALFSHLAQKLPISRLQRDLTDSTVLRNLGVPLAHSLLACHSLLKGFEKLELNQEEINKDLQENWAVVAEAIQTILRRENYPKPYEALKGLTRTSDKITSESIHSFIQTLDVRDSIKEELLAITPFNYTGY